MREREQKGLSESDKSFPLGCHQFSPGLRNRHISVAGLTDFSFLSVETEARGRKRRGEETANSKAT